MAGILESSYHSYYLLFEYFIHDLIGFYFSGPPSYLLSIFTFFAGTSTFPKLFPVGIMMKIESLNILKLPKAGVIQRKVLGLTLKI